jgi:hypothetical protein
MNDQVRIKTYGRRLLFKNPFKKREGYELFGFSATQGWKDENARFLR